MKYLLIITLSIFTNHSVAQVIWPDTSAPCNTTLQACVDGSATGEVIEIHTSSQIDETITSTKAISLIAGVGYKPIFALDRGIEMAGTANTDITVTYSGLTFLRGRIAYISHGLSTATTTLNISNNNILDNSFDFESVRILNFGNHTLNLEVEFNQINYNPASTNLDRNGAIAITNGPTTGTYSSGTVSGRIYNNQIKVVGDESVGIGLYEFSNNSSDLDVSSNTLTGGESAAMYIEKDVQSFGNSKLDFAHNAIYSNQIDTTLHGLKTHVLDGSLEVNAINNTVIGATQGFGFNQAFGGIYDINFYNNLVAHSGTPVVIRNPTTADINVNITFDNDNNLFYDNTSADPDFVAGPAFMAANPMIKSLTNARLRLGSPAIETGNQVSLFFILSVPLIDADGLYRIKNGNPGSGGVALDIGAYEAGDMRILDTKKGTPSNLNPIESAAINAEEFAKLQITQNFNPNGINIFNGIDNDINMGVYRSGSVWSIFSQDE
ncbi:MAG: hypothetical protein L3J52_10155, partial [Proteobacteria bacterium]|nr:hypothetical protein [Pseudomonadota bacterium]